MRHSAPQPIANALPPVLCPHSIIADYPRWSALLVGSLLFIVVAIASIVLSPSWSVLLCDVCFGVLVFYFFAGLKLSSIIRTLSLGTSSKLRAIYSWEIMVHCLASNVLLYKRHQIANAAYLPPLEQSETMSSNYSSRVFFNVCWVVKRAWLKRLFLYWPAVYLKKDSGTDVCGRHPCG